MDDRLHQLEAALAEIRADNQQLRRELEDLRVQLLHGRPQDPQNVADGLAAAADEAPGTRRWWTSRWSVVALISFIIAVPILSLVTRGHLNAFWSAFLGTVNALLVYFIGPGFIRLLIEGLLRAIPGVALGQTTRIMVDRFRRRKARGLTDNHLPGGKNT